MRRSDSVYVAGHAGLVGRALVRRLQEGGYRSLILSTHQELDLEDGKAVNGFFEATRPDVVFLAAAHVGGIAANSARPADFLRKNLAIGLNVITAAQRTGVRRLLNLGSSCIYPRDAPQPIREEHLLTGPLEPTNEAYAVAKIAAVKLCQAYNRQMGTTFISAMPTNLYGPGDNFDLETSHVLPALLRKFHEAREAGRTEVVVWGTGRPRREFMHVDDLADACVFLMEQEHPPELVNVGTGKDLSVAELAQMVREVVGFAGSIVYDPSRPDGAPRKLLDVRRMTEAGWTARVALRPGLEETYRWFQTHHGPSSTGV